MIFHFHALQRPIHQTWNVVEANFIVEESGNCRFVCTIHNSAGRAPLLGTCLRNGKAGERSFIGLGKGQRTAGEKIKGRIRAFSVNC